jgi:predicted nucleic acid-binding Zn ribbon protein
MVSAGSGLIFKGTGFYETDYRSESYKAAAKKEATASSSSSGESKSSTGETKPATTPAPAVKPAKKEKD